MRKPNGENDKETMLDVEEQGMWRRNKSSRRRWKWEQKEE